MAARGTALAVLAVGALSACTMPTTESAKPQTVDPRILAQEQWNACSHFPSVKLVEITDAGKLVVRETAASQPPNAYLRCVSHAALKQVLDGRRDGRDIVRRAYFTDAPSVDGPLSSIAGPLPRTVIEFEPGSDVTFFYDLEGLDRAIQVGLEWHGPGTLFWRTHQMAGPTGATYQGTFSTHRITLPRNQPGLWSVRLSIEGQSAGTYEFRVLGPET